MLASISGFDYNLSMISLKSKIITALIIGGLILAAAAGIVHNILSARIPSNGPNHAGNTAGNLLNGGLFCEAGGLVYFANSFDNNRLYVMNTDETDVRRLNDLNVSSINAGDGYLYFVQGASGFSGEGFGYFRVSPGLYRSRADGKNIAKLKGNPVFIAALCGDNIFYQNFNNQVREGRFTSLYRIGTDGEGDREVSSEVINPSSFANGLIYYSRGEGDHFIYALDVNSLNSYVILESNTFNAIYDNGFIYYMDLDNNYRLCRYSLSNNHIEVLTQDRVDAYNVGYGIIFYQKNSLTEPALIRMSADGSSPLIVREGNHNYINLTSQYVYFREFGDDIRTYRTPLHGPAYADYFYAAMTAVN